MLPLVGQLLLIWLLLLEVGDFKSLDDLSRRSKPYPSSFSTNHRLPCDYLLLIKSCQHEETKAQLLVLAALSILLWTPDIVAQSDGIEAAETSSKLQQVLPRTDAAETEAEAAGDCSSLTGPFCAHTQSMTFFASCMTPISVLDLQQEGSEVSWRSVKTDEGVAKWQRKKCFFQHFTSSWMDSGGNANDLYNQQVTNVDECERLCCEHTQCQSFTFWRGRPCFLRAKSNTPRQDGDSFSGIRLT